MRFIFRHKDLLFFIILSYIDKGLAFVLPLAILYLTQNIEIYNNIEYIFSIASIIAVVLELGGRMYLFYAYTEEEEKNRKKLLNNVKKSYYLINLIYVSIALILFLYGQLGYGSSLLVFFVCIRSLIILFTNSYANYCRLEDKPRIVLYYSTTINLLSLGSIALLHFYTIGNTDQGLMLFFIIQVIFLVVLAIKGIRFFNKENIIFTIKYCKKALIFAWPIMLNLLLVSFINNFGKVYIFNQLSENDMYSFSYLLRISMVVQMTHASVIAYYSKRVYLNESSRIDMKLYKFYTIFLLASVILSLLAIVFINIMQIIPPIEIGTTSVILLFYIFLWCQQAFLEQYLNKINKNRWILYVSIIGVITYILMIFIPFREVTIGYIALCMLISTMVSLSLLVFYFKYKKLI